MYVPSVFGLLSLSLWVDKVFAHHHTMHWQFGETLSNISRIFDRWQFFQPNKKSHPYQNWNVHSVRQIDFEHRKSLPPFFAEVGVCRLQTDGGLLIFS